MLRYGRQVLASRGSVGRGLLWNGAFRYGRQVMVGYVGSWRVPFWQASHGGVRRVMIRSVMAGMVVCKRKEKDMTAYKWKSGYHSKVNAEVAGKVFEELESTVGLTPQNLVDASKSEDAPMHNAFEWNDTVAGNEWRKQQARLHINHLEIVIKSAENKPTTRAYVKYSIDAEEYEHIETVLADPVKSNSFFEMGMKMLNDFKRRYAEVKEFARIIEEIERLEK